MSAVTQAQESCGYRHPLSCSTRPHRCSFFVIYEDASLLQQTWMAAEVIKRQQASRPTVQPFPLGYSMLQYSLPCRDGASCSVMTAVTLLQCAALHLVTGLTHLHPIPHYRFGCMQECLVSLPPPLPVRKCCVNNCMICPYEFIVQLSVWLGVAALVSGVTPCEDVKVCHWASLWGCSQTLSCSSSRLPAEVHNA